VSLISAENTVGVLAGLLAIVAVALAVDRTRLSAYLPGVLVAILLGLILSNLGILPKASPVFGIAGQYLIPIAIPLLLFEANLIRIVREARVLLTGFMVATLGTVLGALLGFLIVRTIVGEEALDPRIIGVIAASWIGGSMNFVATSEALALDEPSLVSSAIAIDNIVGTGMQIAHVALPSIILLRVLIPSKVMDTVDEDGVSVADAQPGLPAEFSISSVAEALAISAAIVFVSGIVAHLAGFANLTIVFITVFSLVLATALPKHIGKMPGAFPTGTFLMYFFFATMGAGSDLSAIAASSLPLLAFTTIMAATHLVVILLGAYLLRIDFAVAVITSNAVALGPPTAAAMAAGKNWHSLVTPGLLIGLMGYACGTFMGIAIARFAHHLESFM